MRAVRKQGAFRDTPSHPEAGRTVQTVTPGDEQYQVLFLGMEEETEEKKEAFCKILGEKYRLSWTSLRNLVDHSPVILRKNLTLKRAENLAETLRRHGALVSIEKRKESLPVALEFGEMEKPRVVLEGIRFWRTKSGIWSVEGRLKNTSGEPLRDTWALIQLFEAGGSFLTFEEVPLPINPLPANASSPFKAFFEGGLPATSASVGFKSSEGHPIPALDMRRTPPEPEIGWDDVGKIPSSEPSHGGPGKEIKKETPIELGRDAVTPPLTKTLPDEKASTAGSQEIRPEPSEDVSEPLDIEKLTAAIVPEPASRLETKPSSSRVRPSADHKDVAPTGTASSGLKRPSPPSRGGTFELKMEASGLNEVGEILKSISRTNPGVQEREDSPPIPEDGFLSRISWMDEFRSAVEKYIQTHPDPFIQWCESSMKEKAFENPLHSLMTILVQARFSQMTPLETAIENTRKVFRFLPAAKVLLDQVPPLEGTQLIPGDQWRILFHKAIPRIRQVAEDVLKQRSWSAPALGQLLQIIPHMSAETSLRALRWTHRLMRETVEIDFRKAPVIIGEGLYRVAARLGVVDPQFDFFQGEGSLGDLKIQAFAKSAFPEDPLKVEEPVRAIGDRNVRDGHCLSMNPRCQGCLFETFCPRLSVHADPSEKGMKLPAGSGGVS